MAGSNPQDVGSLDAAVASTQGQPNTPIGQICAPCVADNWIYMRYEHADGQGVAGASYVVQKVTADGTPTGEVLAEGTTDANGDAFAKLPEEDTQVEFYFYHDPDGDPYDDPEAQKPLEEPEEGFWEGMWKGITGAADWVWGVLEGDFNEDASTGQIIGRMILTMIPGIDQLADVQDVINILYKLIWKKEYDEKWNWILLVITLIGLIPVLGSLAKGLLKLVFKKFGDISALRGLYGVFNFFSIGNAHRWLRDFATNLTGAHLNAAIDVLNTMMTRVVYYMTEAKTWLGGITGWNGLIDEGLLKVASFQSMAPRKLREAAADLQKKLLDTIAVAMTRIQRVSTKNGPDRPHVVKQEVVEPPERLPGAPTRRARQTDPGCFDAVGYSRRAAPGDVARQQDIQREYARQLQDQADGLNDLSVGEYLDARDAYRTLGRSGVSDGVAQENARQELLGRITPSIQESLENSGMSAFEAIEEAERRASEVMSNLAALHDPDMVAGGADRITRVGNAGVNSSIGGSWGDATKPNSRIARIDAAALEAANDPAIGRDARMNTKLEPCRGSK